MERNNYRVNSFCHMSGRAFLQAAMDSLWTRICQKSFRAASLAVVLGSISVGTAEAQTRYAPQYAQPAGTPRLLQFSQPTYGGQVQAYSLPTVTPIAGQAQAPSSEVQRQLELLYQQRGQQAPNMLPPGQVAQPQYQQPQASQPQYQQPQYQRPSYQQPQFQQPQFQQPSPGQPLLQHPTYQNGSVQSQQTAFPQPGSHSSSNGGFLGKVFSQFRRDKVPAGPPTDPGISYPRGQAGPQTANNNPAYGAQQPRTVAPPVMPGAPAAPAAPAAPPVVSKTAPGLLQTPEDVAEISDPLKFGILPPGPDGDTSVPVVAAPKTAASSQSLLPAAPPARPAPPPAAGANTVLLPPAPDSSHELMSDEPSDELAFPGDSDDLGGFEFEDTVTAAPRAERQPEPLTIDLSPSTDSPAKTPVAESNSAAPAEESSEEEITRPYQGLTLEEELFAQSAELSSSEPEFKKPLNPAADLSTDTQLLPAPLATSNDGIETAEPELKVAEAPAPKASLAEESNLKLLPAPGASEPQRLSSLSTRSIEEIRTAKSSSADPQTQNKLERIAHREGEGLKGFCPVALRDSRDLVDARPEFSASYRGETYYFSSEKALQSFLSTPRMYVPAAGGNDVIHHALTGEKLMGKLDHAAWYKGRLYLFSSAETMETFQSAPSIHAAVD